jgi:hypothetical protein
MDRNTVIEFDRYMNTSAFPVSHATVVLAIEFEKFISHSNLFSESMTQ